MMKSGVPWSIKGIDDEIREAARAAASRSGLTVSEWLNDLIAKQAAEQDIALGRSRDDDDHQVEDDAETNAVAAAVERLTQRIWAMDDNARATLSGLQERLDEIERRLGKVANAGRGGERARSLKGVADLVDRLSREVENADETARSTVEGFPGRTSGRRAGRDADADDIAAAIRSLDTRISSLSGRMSPPPASESPPRLDAIKARLDALLARAPEKASGRTALDATLRSLETHIDQAKHRLAATPPRRSQPLSMSAEEEGRLHRIEEQLDEITAGIGDRATGPKPSADDVASAVAEIAARQNTIDYRADYAAIAHEQRQVSDTLAALRTDIAGLAGRLESQEGGGESAPSFDTDQLSGMRADLEAIRAAIGDGTGFARLDALGEEIGAVRQALEADDSPRAIARLEMRVAELARGTEAALNATNAASRRSDPDVVARLESRLDAIAARIDSFLGRKDSVEAVADLHDRFATLLERLEDTGCTREGSAGILDEVKAEIAGLREEVADRPVPNVDHLESQVAELAERLDAMTRSESGGQALAELEAQVARIASELERSAPRTATLRQVEENLARLQGFLSDNREESVEAARIAARDAVREIAASQGDSDLVRALKGDLANIRAAAEEADQRTQETLGSVHETLARVVERLTRLESETSESDADLASEPLRATGTYGAEPPTPRVKAGPAPGGPSPLLSTPEENRPLEPGSGKPDLAALRELAKSASGGADDRAGDRRADFIAAARRAAQAAAAEAAAHVEEGAGEDKPGTFARIGQAILKRKRPLLIAAAALILAISAVHLFTERDANTAANAPRGGATASQVQEAPLPAPAPRVVAAKGSPAKASAKIAEPKPVMRPAKASPGVTFAAPEGLGGHFGEVTAPPATTFVPAAAPASAISRDAANKAPTPPAAAAPAVDGEIDQAIGPPKLREAAAAGDPAAAFEIATRYAEGNGVRLDFAEAAEWYRHAAEAGIAVAQYRLGSLYERGQGVKREPAAAVTWYQRAADRGNVGAMHNLAVLMSEGVDGPPDHGKAFEWFLAAAKYGVKDSQYNLGVIYARGLGPAQDLVESYKWFAIAAARGDGDAAARRDEVAKVLSPDDLAKARAAVQAWRETPVIPEANTVATPPGGWEGDGDSITEADRRSLVRKIQTLLAEQGYDPGPLDGYEGPKTRDAVRAFQRNVGLTENGQINADLVSALVNPPT